MKRCYLDSNILIYFKDHTSIWHRKAVQLVEGLVAKEAELVVSSLVFDEFIHAILVTLRISKQQEIFEKAEKMFLEILDLPHLFIVSAPLEIEMQKEVFDFMEEYSLKPRDAYHLLTAISGDADSLATFDQDFKKVFKAKVLEKA